MKDKLSGKPGIMDMGEKVMYGSNSKPKKKKQIKKQDDKESEMKTASIIGETILGTEDDYGGMDSDIDGSNLNYKAQLLQLKGEHKKLKADFSSRV